MSENSLPQESHSELKTLFEALDGRPIDGEPGSPARVVGIHDDGRQWWIQVARDDDAASTAVVRLSRFASAAHAAAALSRWELATGRLPHIINAMCAV